MNDEINRFAVNRETWIQAITSSLCSLAGYVHTQNAVNLTSGNIHSEYFYRDFLNAIFSLNLTNENHVASNSPGFDLIDNNKSLIVQVSSQESIQKVHDSLSRLTGRFDRHMSFWYVSITDKLPNWQATQFHPPDNILFNPATCVFDNKRLLNQCMGLDNQRLQQAYNVMSASAILVVRPT